MLTHNSGCYFVFIFVHELSCHLHYNIPVIEALLYFQLLVTISFGKSQGLMSEILLKGPNHYVTPVPAFQKIGHFLSASQIGSHFVTIGIWNQLIERAN